VQPRNSDAYNQNQWASEQHPNRRENFSDQKTPSALPNTFLYRAHLNLVNSGDQPDALQADQRELEQFQMQVANNNVSAFQMEEEKK
jgi:hypothetical protein